MPTADLSYSQPKFSKFQSEKYIGRVRAQRDAKTGKFRATAYLKWDPTVGEKRVTPADFPQFDTVEEAFSAGKTCAEQWWSATDIEEFTRVARAERFAAATARAQKRKARPRGPFAAPRA